jgi:hypothetical protein
MRLHGQAAAGSFFNRECDMAKKKANTPKPAKPSGKAAKTATNAKATAKNRKRDTRDDTMSREEVRRMKKPQQGPR